MTERALVLLNSLSIVGPNMRHEEQGMWPDGKHSEDNTWDGPGWCVCRRVWPCEAKELGDVILALLEERRVLREALEEIADLYHNNHNIRPGTFAIRAGQIATAALQAEPARAEEGAS